MEEVGFICEYESRRLINKKWEVYRELQPWTYKEYVLFFRPELRHAMLSYGGRESKRTVYKEYGGTVWQAVYVRSTSPNAQEIVKRTIYPVSLFAKRTPDLLKKIENSGEGVEIKKKLKFYIEAEMSGKGE